LVSSASIAWGDVIELRSGERIEGTFKGADDTAVRIESDGRLLTFKPELVRAIYYGSLPAPPPSAGPAPAAAPTPAAPPVQIAERGEAIDALRMLRSVARTGVTYPEYAPRVSEARGVVDRYLEREDGTPAIRGAIVDSFTYYALAESAWKAGLSRGNYADIGTDGALVRCVPAQRVIAESKQRNPFLWRSKGPGEATATGTVIATSGIEALWACAADRLGAAEKLWTGAKKN